MSKKFDDFVDALEALCVAHQVELITDGYSDLLVMNRSDNTDTLRLDGISDGTDDMELL